MNAEILLGLYCWPLPSTQASPLEAFTILKGTSDISFATIGSSKRRPIRRFTEYRVFMGLVTAWGLAAWPTRRSPESVKATMEGVVRAPSEFSITLVSPPSMTATHELVVPRSIPMTFAMTALSSLGSSSRPRRHLANPQKRYLPETPGQDRGYIGPKEPPAMDLTAEK